MQILPHNSFQRIKKLLTNITNRNMKVCKERNLSHSSQFFSRPKKSLEKDSNKTISIRGEEDRIGRAWATRQSTQFHLRRRRAYYPVVRAQEPWGPMGESHRERTPTEGSRLNVAGRESQIVDSPVHEQYPLLRSENQMAWGATAGRCAVLPLGDLFPLDGACERKHLPRISHSELFAAYHRHSLLDPHHSHCIPHGPSPEAARDGRESSKVLDGATGRHSSSVLRVPLLQRTIQTKGVPRLPKYPSPQVPATIVATPAWTDRNNYPRNDQGCTETIPPVSALRTECDVEPTVTLSTRKSIPSTK